MKTIYSILIAALLLSQLSSCYLMTGIHKPKKISEDDILKYCKKKNIPFENTYELDRSFYLFSYALQKKGLDKIAKDYYQILKAVYFDSTGRMQSMHINCYANERGAKLNWNVNGAMDQFPPLQVAPIDTFLTIERQLKMIRPLKYTKPFDPTQYDYVVAIYWEKFSAKKSIGLIRAIEDNVMLAIGKRVKILYVNSDNFYSPGNSAHFTGEEQKRVGIFD